MSARMTTDPDSPLCPDWVFLNNSNVHIAKHRGWFKTYTPFASIIDPSPFFSPSKPLPVLGIGTVEILTKRSPNRSGVSSHGSLHLQEVLHVPGFICNVIGQPIVSSDGYGIITSCGTKSMGTITDSQGKVMAYFDPNRPLFSIRVRHPPTGPKLGPHVLQHGEPYMLGCRWSLTEQQKWQQFKIDNGRANSMPGSAGTTDKNPPYTEEEKVYLKENWRSEYHFLRQHGLHIHKDEDRAEGRSILRQIRDEHASEEESEDDEFDLEGHQADYNFSSRQLDWIEKYYGNSETFMLLYGLKFYDDDDLEEAKMIADAMMAQDEETSP